MNIRFSIVFVAAAAILLMMPATHAEVDTLNVSSSVSVVGEAIALSGITSPSNLGDQLQRLVTNPHIQMLLNHVLLSP